MAVCNSRMTSYIRAKDSDNGRKDIYNAAMAVFTRAKVIVNDRKDNVDGRKDICTVAMAVFSRAMTSDTHAKTSYSRALVDAV